MTSEGWTSLAALRPMRIRSHLAATQRQGDPPMSQTDIHPDNDTPTASDADIKRMDKDTPFHPGSTATPLSPSPMPEKAPA
jgi:hypothetical protein